MVHFRGSSKQKERVQEGKGRMQEGEGCLRLGHARRGLPCVQTEGWRGDGEGMVVVWIQYSTLQYHATIQIQLENNNNNNQQ